MQSDMDDEGTKETGSTLLLPCLDGVAVLARDDLDLCRGHNLV